MTSNYKNMKDRVSCLVTRLIVNHPFFGIFLANTDIIEDNSISTAATNGVNIYYNSDFFNQLDDEQVSGVLLHEVFHACYSHCDKKRRGIRNPKKWNVAVDYAINWEIDEMARAKQGVKLPHNIKINGKDFNVFLDYKYKDKYAEEIYDLLPEDMSNKDGFDIHIDMPEDETIKQGMEDRIVAAYEISKKEEGKMPAGIARAVEEIRKARVPWNRIFHRYVGAALSKEDYSYVHPNRRFIGEDLYMPSLRSNKIGRILFAPDMSGSIGDAEVGAFTNELTKISALISEVVVASWDTQVNTWETVRDMSNIKKACKFKGGGGTSVQCVFDEIKKRRESFELVIILTDGYYGKLPPKHTVKYPVIFVMTTPTISEWGSCVQMRL